MSERKIEREESAAKSEMDERWRVFVGVSRQRLRECENGRDMS